MVALTLAVGREVLGLSATSLVDALRHGLCKGHNSISRQLSPGEARGLSIPCVKYRRRECQAALARKLMMLKRCQDSHRGYACSSGSLVHKGNSLVGPGGV